jgi:uncharacterized protein YjbI with pentapeptide repeats
VLRNCVFVELLDLSKALLVDVDLSGSQMPGLNAAGADIRHGVILRSVAIDGPTELGSITIGGTLSLTGGTFTNPNGDAISADGAHIKGAVFCRAGFHAEGEVRLIGATIGGQLNLTGGTFTNPGGYAISADQAHIRSGVFCQADFHAEGGVTFHGTTIDGQLDLTGGTFTNPNGNAISAEGAHIKGSIFCGAGFHAKGEVRLLGVTIGGQLNLTGGTFTNPDNDAIKADQAHIKGGVFCGAGFHAEGEVRLLGVTIGGQLSLSGGAFTNPNGRAISADGAHVTGDVFCRAGFKADGEVRLPGATIGGQLALTGGTFTNPHGNAINAERATIGTLVLNNSKSTGRIVLLGAHTGYLSDDLNSWHQLSSASLLDFTYDRVITQGWSTKDRLLWLQKDPEYRAQPYEQLAQTLRAQGHEREARQVMVARNRRRRKQQTWYRKIPEYLFDWLLVYGYHPLQRTLPALGLLYALGLFLFFSAQHNHAIIATRAAIHQSATTSGTTAGGVATSPPTAAGQPRPVTATATCPSDYPCFSPWAFTADALIPLVNTHQTDFWAVSGSQKIGFWAILYSWLAAPLGWLLTTAAALGFTGLIRRD